mmetsp:Transcript_51837/g.102364  ORF Transcript_51837/g.102364 Transcript_51837/m.102364 type:complete len:271 (+) Transcript_51837:50-862(+)
MTKYLRTIGYCGVDDSVAPEMLKLISDKYKWVEWGVLFRSDLEGTARYPSPAWVQRLLELTEISADKGSVSIRLAGHLCGNRCQDVLDGQTAFVQQLFEWGYRRVQINATAANSVVVDPTQTKMYVNNIISCMQSVPKMEFIIQCNEETRSIYEPLIAEPQPNMSLLYDASCGKGVRVNSFPSPMLHPTIPCGYAGGIGPDCIAEIMTAVKGVVSVCPEHITAWVDMESSLRAIVIEKDKVDQTEVRRDVFSLEKCFGCILIAESVGFNR